MADLQFSYNDPTASPLDGRDVGFLRSGDILLVGANIVRPLVFAPDVSGYTGTVAPGFHGYFPLNFRQGTIGARLVPHNRNLLLTTTSGTHQFVQGTILVVPGGAPIDGALQAFGVWPSSGSYDPYDFYIQSAPSITSGNVSAGFARNNAVFVPHRKARYLGVGARVQNMPNTGSWRNHYFKKWMLEKAAIGGTFPSPTYSKAREVRVYVKPDRINLLVNPSFTSNTTGWNTWSGPGAIVRDTSTTKVGVASGRYPTTGASAVFIDTPYASVVKPNRDYTLSIWLKGTGSARLEMYDPDSSTPGIATTDTQVLTSDWVRYSITGTTRSSTTRIMLVVYQQSTGNNTMWLSGAMIERGRDLRDYFDGSWSIDTMWESGGTPGLARSYLYKNFSERYSAIKRVLDDNVPLGIGIANPVMGTFPVDW